MKDKQMPEDATDKRCTDARGCNRYTQMPEDATDERYTDARGRNR